MGDWEDRRADHDQYLHRLSEELSNGDARFRILRFFRQPMSMWRTHCDRPHDRIFCRDTDGLHFTPCGVPSESVGEEV